MTAYSALQPKGSGFETSHRHNPTLTHKDTPALLIPSPYSITTSAYNISKNGFHVLNLFGMWEVYELVFPVAF